MGIGLRCVKAIKIIRERYLSPERCKKKINDNESQTVTAEPRRLLVTHFPMYDDSWKEISADLKET